MAQVHGVLGRQRQRIRAKIGTVAVVGADGSGKSTVIDSILQSFPGPIKYIYMGFSLDSSNVILPTSRLLMSFRKRRMSRYLDDADRIPPADLMSSEMKKALPSGRITKALGLMNRLAEEWYRQLYISVNRLRGYTVLCDRHFLFESCPDATLNRAENRLLSVRIHNWVLRRLYPRPDLVIFLDAPAETLYARKPEWTLKHLEQQRANIAEQGKACDNFVRIDASQPLESVISKVSKHIDGFLVDGVA